MQKNLAKIYFLVVFAFLLFFSPFLAHAATLSISPSSGNFSTGDNVTLKVLVSSNDASFNAVSGVVYFPTSIFSISSASKSGSVLNFWVTEPTISKSSGTVKFEGVALGGSTNTSGTIITVNLKVINSGLGKALFQSGQVLANDGQGTDITGDLNSASFSVVEAIAKTKETKSNIAPIPESIPVAPVIEITQPTPSLKAPDIMFGSKYGADSIIGSSDYPKAQVLVTFISEDGVKIFVLGNSDVDGSFNMVVPNSLRRGTYTAKAVMIKEDKTNSEESNIITIKVGNIFSDLGWQVELTMLLLVLAIMYLILRTHVHIQRKTDKSAKDELHKAESLIHKSFDILRDDVGDYDKSKISSAERRHLSNIEKEMNDAEKIIAKKIKDIE